MSTFAALIFVGIGAKQFKMKKNKQTKDCKILKNGVLDIRVAHKIVSCWRNSV